MVHLVKLKLKCKGKRVPITDHEGPWGIQMQGSIYLFTVMALERGRMASPMLSLLYPQLDPSNHFMEG